MLLKSLAVTLQEYGVNKGKYEGEAHFINEYAGVKIMLTPEASAKILSVVAEEIVAAAKDTASLIAQNVIEQVNSSRLLEENHIN